MIPKQLDIFESFAATSGTSKLVPVTTPQSDGATLRDEGIARAAHKTERADPEWANDAYRLLIGFNCARFMAEEFREWAYAHGLRKPASERAWGGVYQRARREGLLIPDGFGTLRTPGQHQCPGRIWRKN